MWRAGIIDCHSVQCSLVTDTQPCLLTYLKAGFKLPNGCCCNSSVHCSTGPQQHVDDDLYVSGEGSLGGGYSYSRGPHFFLNRGPVMRKSGPASETANSSLWPGGRMRGTWLMVSLVASILFLKYNATLFP